MKISPALRLLRFSQIGTDTRSTALELTGHLVFFLLIS